MVNRCTIDLDYKYGTFRYSNNLEKDFSTSNILKILKWIFETEKMFFKNC